MTSPLALARRQGRRLLDITDEALTPFTEQLINVGAEVFAPLAPRSGRFTAGALLRLLKQVDQLVAGVAELHGDLAARHSIGANRTRNPHRRHHPYLGPRVWDWVSRRSASFDMVPSEPPLPIADIRSGGRHACPTRIHEIDGSSASAMPSHRQHPADLPEKLRDRGDQADQQGGGICVAMLVRVCRSIADRRAGG